MIAFCLCNYDYTYISIVRCRDFVLVHPYRPATARHYLGLPGGYLAPGESPEEGAGRELPEETSYLPTNCRVIAQLDPLPSFVRSQGYYILCEAIPTGTGIQDRSEIDEG